MCLPLSRLAVLACLVDGAKAHLDVPSDSVACFFGWFLAFLGMHVCPWNCRNGFWSGVLARGTLVAFVLVSPVITRYDFICPVWSCGWNALLTCHVASIVHLKAGWLSFAGLDCPAVVALTSLATGFARYGFLAGLDTSFNLKAGRLADLECHSFWPGWNVSYLCQDVDFGRFDFAWFLPGVELRPM
ncbi:hypothetical protein Nepgr_033682 [Nepenthes gracilis]|uniref:Uncharacterized protein n=1 Tax=Nepenthes gracilis TaxID=150966 RepID=A0AAD3TMQ6_NEPGR|nr:hypothetical protein Nepgr_033682 [Nepenthes gracilis]